MSLSGSRLGFVCELQLVVVIHPHRQKDFTSMGAQS